jgi:3-oxoacyl-[acyl-carrier-protein] synthase-3
MAIFEIPDIKIAGLAAIVPKNEISNMDYKWISEKERLQLIKVTGIEKRRAVVGLVATSDLCMVAAEKLIEELNWDKKDIDILIFVTQSRDYLIPSTSTIIQDRLGLPKSCIAMDISMGCSGYVYGLSVITSLMKTSGIKKGLLLVGDITTINASYRDKSTYPLFGDAASVTALEYSEKCGDFKFNLQTDGSGHKAIMIPDGGMRNFVDSNSLKFKRYSKGVIRKRIQLALDGIEVFNFSLREVSPNVKALIEFAEENIDNFDSFVFHQANMLINESIRKRLKLPKEKVPYTLSKYGNTSSGSIPLTMVSELREELRNKKMKLLLSGFGVGLSWGSVILSTDKIIVPELIEYQ